MIVSVQIVQIGRATRCMITRAGYEPNALGHTLRTHDWAVKAASHNRILKALADSGASAVLGGVLFYKIDHD